MIFYANQISMYMTLVPRKFMHKNSELKSLQQLLSCNNDMARGMVSAHVNKTSKSLSWKLICF